MGSRFIAVGSGLIFLASCGQGSGAGGTTDTIAGLVGDYDVAGVAPNNCLAPNTVGEVRRSNDAPDAITLRLLPPGATYVATVQGDELVVDPAISPLEQPGVIDEAFGTIDGDVINFTYVVGFTCDTRWTPRSAGGGGDDEFDLQLCLDSCPRQFGSCDGPVDADAVASCERACQGIEQTQDNDPACIDALNSFNGCFVVASCGDLDADVCDDDRTAVLERCG